MYSRRRGHPNPVVVALIVGLLAVIPASPAAAAARATPDPARQATEPLAADVAGQPVPLAMVGSLHCHDFDRPQIHCFATEAELRAALAPTLVALDTSNYVEIFENTTYGGASMFVSTDYSALAVIGWNDRISSFKGQNGQFGKFYTDWFFGGSSWSFCCNQQASSMGSFNDAISSVLRG